MFDLIANFLSHMIASNEFCQHKVAMKKWLTFRK